MSATSKADDNECIRVVVRCRPMSMKETKEGRKSIIVIDNETRSVYIRNPGNDNEPPKTFTFDASYDDRTQQRIFYDESCSSIIEGALGGFNSTIFAYGQTGCGKSFTMQGPSTSSEDLKGVIPNCFSHIFDFVKACKDVQFLIHCQYLELCNEDIKDLLVTEKISSKLNLREDPQKGMYVSGITNMPVESPEDLMKMLDRGLGNRTAAATLMTTDHRSHVIFTIIIEKTSKDCSSGMELVRVGKLNLVDLAGSEREKDVTLKEGIKINQSLSALGNVISALSEGRKGGDIPYRDSKLTRLLQDSLGGNTKTMMIAAISPADCNFEETMSTLTYADLVKKITNKPKINEELREILEDGDSIRNGQGAPADYVAAHRPPPERPPLPAPAPMSHDLEQRGSHLPIAAVAPTRMWTASSKTLQLQQQQLPTNNHRRVALRDINNRHGNVGGMKMNGHADSGARNELSIGYMLRVLHENNRRVTSFMDLRDHSMVQPLHATRRAVESEEMTSRGIPETALERALLYIQRRDRSLSNGGDSDDGNDGYDDADGDHDLKKAHSSQVSSFLSVEYISEQLMKDRMDKLQQMFYNDMMENMSDALTSNVDDYYYRTIADSVRDSGGYRPRQLARSFTSSYGFDSSSDISLALQQQQQQLYPYSYSDMDNHLQAMGGNAMWYPPLNITSPLRTRPLQHHHHHHHHHLMNYGINYDMSFHDNEFGRNHYGGGNLGTITSTMMNAGSDLNKTSGHSDRGGYSVNLDNLDVNNGSSNPMAFLALLVDYAHFNAAPLQSSHFNSAPPQSSHFNAAPPQSSHFNSAPPQSSHFNSAPPQSSDAVKDYKSDGDIDRYKSDGGIDRYRRDGGIDRYKSDGGIDRYKSDGGIDRYRRPDHDNNCEGLMLANHEVDDGDIDRGYSDDNYDGRDEIAIDDSSCSFPHAISKASTGEVMMVDDDNISIGDSSYRVLDTTSAVAMADDDDRMDGANDDGDEDDDGEGVIYSRSRRWGNNSGGSTSRSGYAIEISHKESVVAAVTSSAQMMPEDAVKRKRGRPRKTPVPVPATSAAAAATTTRPVAIADVVAAADHLRVASTAATSSVARKRAMESHARDHTCTEAALDQHLTHTHSRPGDTARMHVSGDYSGSITAGKTARGNTVAAKGEGNDCTSDVDSLLSTDVDHE